MGEKPALNISKETKKDVCGTLETFVETFGEGTFLNILWKILSRKFAGWKEGGLAGTGGPCSVCAVDLGVDGAVVVTQAEDSVSCIRQDRGERVRPAPPWTIKHLRLKLAKLVLQVRELVRKGLNDRWVPCPEGCLIRGPEVLGSWGISGWDWYLHFIPTPQLTFLNIYTSTPVSRVSQTDKHISKAINLFWLYILCQPF